MLHYCSVQLAHIADNARDLDLAVRWGFGWREGPFELWQSAGWARVAQWIAEDIAAGKALVQAIAVWLVTCPMILATSQRGPFLASLASGGVFLLFWIRSVPSRVVRWGRAAKSRT